MPIQRDALIALRERECSLAIAGDTVIGAGAVGDASTWFDEPEVTEVARMPASAAGRFLFQTWPGRDAALALLAQETAHD